APPYLRPPSEWPVSDSLEAWRLRPRAPDWATGFSGWRPGELGALERLDRFLGAAAGDYAAARDFPGKAGTSRLSPHLAFGEIGPRQVARSVVLAEALGELSTAQAEAFLRELGWREFNVQLLFHHPRMGHENLNVAFDAFPWRDDPPALAAWREGRTGYPLVDAGMRELWTTGWMHNRVRMVVASFLVKHLMLDWRLGEAWFWDTLVDADPANNAANWQWVAGSGADAPPFFRIFNPTAQGERFDPDGAYVRRWVPEVAALPASLAHQPWRAAKPPPDYPPPLVDHAEARGRALQAYAALKA
ncbi:MAG TPA: deoxyribodipyrimidine photo-lyase, partial [Caulobacteraceae bacterium]|nr:deoxyribodipyrimidine photo-lyase [Caulobacteraceae bacterium]